MTRYALYFAPECTSPWWQAGCRWLGRDPEHGGTPGQPALAGMAPAQLHALTRAARRYGFHATLKAPFRLAAAVSTAQLDAALAEFCRTRRPLQLAPLQVAWMDGFLCLRPPHPVAALDALAQDCVRGFEPLRAPLTPDELARRRPHLLSPRQQVLLQRWGYPYTEEEFRFHLTLSDVVHDAADMQVLQRGAERHFDISAPLEVAGLALFCQDGPGADFRLLRRYPFCMR